MIRLRPVFFGLALMTVLVGSTMGQQLPPAFPRDGAKKILENDRVIVWDMQLRKGQRAAMHTHPYDIVSVTLRRHRSIRPRTRERAPGRFSRTTA